MDTKAPPTLDAFNAAAQGLERYLLLDCYVRPPLEDELEESGIADEEMLRLPVFTDIGGKRDPLLIHLPEDPDSLLEKAALRWAVGQTNASMLGSRSVCAWIASKRALPQLGEHLKRRCRMRVRGKDESEPFRFFDPRVMRALEYLLDDWQKTVLFGPIRLWGYIDEQGRFRLIEHHAKTTIASPLFLSPLQDAELGMNEFAQWSLQWLRKHRPAWEEDIARHIVEYIREAIVTHGLKQKSSVAAYGAARWLVEHGHLTPDFLAWALERHRETTAALDAVIQNHAPGAL